MSRWLITSGVWQPFKDGYETTVIVIHRDLLDVPFVKKIKSLFDNINAQNDDDTDYHVTSWRDFYEFVFAQKDVAASEDGVFERVKSLLDSKGLKEGEDYTVETRQQREDYFNNLPDNSPFYIKTPKEKQQEEQDRINKQKQAEHENDIYKQIQISRGELPFGKDLE